MVVPMSDNSKQNTKRIVGDGKNIMLRTNSDSLLVIGSGNSVTVNKNEGFIKVVGDGCRVSVAKGQGRIEYKGDGGYLETGSSVNNIKYRGDGGKIVQLSNEFKNKVKLSKEERKPARSHSERSKSSNINVTNTSHCTISTNPETVVQFPCVQTPKIGWFVIGKTHH